MLRTTLASMVLVALVGCSKEEVKPTEEAKPEAAGVTTAADPKGASAPTPKQAAPTPAAPQGATPGPAGVAAPARTIEVAEDHAKIGDVEANKGSATVGNTKVDKTGVSTGGVKIDKTGVNTGGVKIGGTPIVPPATTK